VPCDKVRTHQWSLFRIDPAVEKMKQGLNND